jgi:PAS domain S-box-containing protein
MDNSLAALAEKVGIGSPSHLQRLEFLVSTVPVVIHTCKAEGDFSATFVSDGVRALWGYEPEDFLKNNRFWIDRLHPEDAERIVAGLGVVLTAGQYCHEYRFRTMNGEYRWVRDELRLLRGIAGEPLEVVGHCFDITERRRSEDSAAFLASIVQSSEDSIVGVGLDGIILSWNASSERFWGYTAEEVIGKHVQILFPPERVQEFANSIDKIHRDEPIKRFETVRVRKNGSLVAVAVILSPVKDPHGTLLGVAAIYRDLTA